MANVLFKRGQQASLPAQGSAQDGVFYLTQDTNRLYIGEGTSLKLLNQTVQIVASLNELVSMSNAWTATQKESHRNDFYYVSSGAESVSGNILAVWNGTDWVQINPDTNTTLDSVAFSASSNNNVASVSLETTDSASNHEQDTFTITGAGGVTVSASNKNVTVTGETYSIGRSVTDDTHASILLDATLGQDSNITLEGSSTLTFTSTASGIKFDARDTVNSSASLSLPSDGSLAVSVTDNYSGSVSSTLQNVGIAVGASTGNVGNYYVPITNTANKTAANIYTADEIDALINGLDGMTFKGTFGSNSATVSTLPTTNVRNGDVYVISSDDLQYTDIPGLAAGTTVRVGDMVIAQGTETNGYIASGLTWVYVPSGNDSADAFSYHAIATAVSNTLLLENELNTTIAQLSLTAGNDIVITSTAPDTNNLASTISHATYNAVTPVADSLVSNGSSSFTAIKSLTLTNGHVTGITTDTFTPVTYTLTGSAVTEGTRFSASNTSNDITAAFTLTDSNSTGCGVGNLKLSSSSITFSKGANNEVVADLVWGTF